MPTHARNPLTSQTESLNILKIIDEFILDRQARRLSRKTIQFYREELRYFTQYLGDKKTLADITSDVIRNYLFELSQHRNPGGQHASFRALRAFLRWVWNEYEIETRNPITKIAAPVYTIQPLQGLDEQSFWRMIDICSVRDKAILFTLADTGIRASELISLKITDLDPHTGTLMIRHGKGNKQRTAYLEKTALRAIRRYLKERDSNSQFLFLTETGTPLTFAGLREIVRRLASRVSIPVPGLHDFRRFFALQSLRNGMDLLTLSRLLGHTSITTTQRYLNLDTTDLQLAHKKYSPLENKPI